MGEEVRHKILKDRCAVHICSTNSATNGWVAMFDENEIEKIFVVLGLETEEKRQAILSRGFFRKPERKPKYRIVLDNATTVGKEGGPQDTGLE